MLGLVLITARQFPADLRAVPERVVRTLGSPDTEASLQWRVLLTNRLVALILAYQLLSAAVTQLLDYMVWNRAAARFPDPSELAQFQGVFGAIINVVSVLFVVTLGGWMLTRFGLRLGLAANPLGVLVLLVATVVVGYLVGPVALVFFVLVCAQQVTDITLTDGSTRTSINATYQALPPRERVRAQTLVEGAGVPLALGFVGILLIGFDVLGLGVRAVGVITLLLSVVWLVTAALAYREYGVNLRAVLTKRPWDPVALRIDDAASRAAVDEMLASPDPHDVGLALDALVDAGDDISGYVLALLDDPGPAQRELGLELAAGAGYRELPAVAAEVHRLLGDPDPGVALWAAAAMVRRGAGRGGPGVRRGSWPRRQTTRRRSTARCGPRPRSRTPSTSPTCWAWPRRGARPPMSWMPSLRTRTIWRRGSKGCSPTPRCRGRSGNGSCTHSAGPARPRHATCWWPTSVTATRASSRQPRRAWSR